MPYVIENKLAGMPHRPSRKGPYGMGSPLNLAKVKKMIGRTYDMHKAIVERERMA
jgi:hypothetical protein